MTIYIKCTECGSQSHINGVRPKEANNKQAWYDEHYVCPICYKKQKAQEFNALVEANRELATNMDLPKIEKGTAKQIAWATDIRTAYLNKMLDNREYAESLDSQFRNEYIELVEEYFSETDALYFIDNRYTFTKSSPYYIAHLYGVLCYRKRCGK